MSGLGVMRAGLGLLVAMGFVVACGNGLETGLPLQDAVSNEQPGAEVTGDDAVMPDTSEPDQPGFDLLPGDDAADDTPVAVDLVLDGGKDVLAPDAVTPDGGSDAIPEVLEPAPLFRYANSHASSAWLDLPPACREDAWLQKYFRYRLRLRGNGTAEFPGFVSVGESPGQSLLAGMRDPELKCDNSYWTEGCAFAPPADTQGSYAWGDGTIWLGLYIATLATEYKVFAELGIDTTQTVGDLYYALMAFNRLDVRADAFYGITDPGVALDGFFIRQDIPRDFYYADDTHTTYRFPRDDGFAGYGCIESGFSCHPADPGDISTGLFESQDQVIRMQFGLAMVAKLVPDSVTFAGTSIRHEARAINDRMVQFLRDHGWKVIDPNGDQPPAEWGGSAVYFSNAIAKCANLICGEGCEADFGIDDYRDFTSETLGTLGLAGDDVSWWAQTSTNINMGLMLATCGDQWSQDKLARRSLNYGAAIFPLAHAVLFDLEIPADAVDWRMDEMLSSAPCDGPCHETTGCVSVPGWSGDDRWRNPEKNFGSVNRSVGEYSGYDYMLMHNLSFIGRKGLFEYVIPEMPASGCESFWSIDRLIANGPTSGMTYDPTNPCAAADLSRMWCGRRFVRWLDEAYKGNATIWLGRARWECVGSDPCQLVIEDKASGDGGVDLMIGTSGPDSLFGSRGDDCIYGMDGDDTLEGGQGYDRIYGGGGHDAMYGESNDWTVADGEDDILFGEDGNDTIEGNPGNDAIFAGPGDDEVDGNSGDDFIEGGDGHDTLWGSPGNDQMDGGPGNDRMDGDDGDDYMLGGLGNDFVRGSAGGDVVISGDGCDVLCGCSGADALWGNWSGCTVCRYGSCSWLGADGNDDVNEMNGCAHDLESYDDGYEGGDACNADL